MKQKDQSPTRIVHSVIDLKSWLEKTPTVEQARPGQCPVCEAASRPLGGVLGLWGHGLKSRQQRGPLEPQGRPQVVVVQGRRYLCRRCGAVVLVVPQGVVARRHYAGSAIALALALWGVVGLLCGEVRKRVSPWQLVAAAEGGSWRTLRRWAAAVRGGELFDCCARRPCPPEFTLRQVAKQAAQTLGAYAPPSLAQAPPEVVAFSGGLRMA